MNAYNKLGYSRPMEDRLAHVHGDEAFMEETPARAEEREGEILAMMEKAARADFWVAQADSTNEVCGNAAVTEAAIQAFLSKDDAELGRIVRTTMESYLRRCAELYS